MLVVFAVSCAKMPNEVVAPRMKIDIQNGTNKVTLEISFYNDSDSTVFSDFTGKVGLKSPDGGLIFESDFSVKKIFPYSSSSALVEVDLTQEQLNSVLAVTNTSQDDLNSKKVLTDVFVTADMLTLNDVDADRDDIIDVLREQIND